MAFVPSLLNPASLVMDKQCFFHRLKAWIFRYQFD